MRKLGFKNKGRLQDGSRPFVLDDFVPVKFEDFRVFELLPVNCHADESDLLVKAAVACRSWIDVEQVQFLVVHHL